MSSGAALLLVATLLWAYLLESVGDVTLYYSFRTINPLFAGGLALGVLVILLAVSVDAVSPVLGVGIALGLSLVTLLVVVAWVLTGRADVFRAPGWAFPAQQWVLVVSAGLMLVGAGWEARNLGMLSRKG